MWNFFTNIVDKFLQDPKKFFRFGLNLLFLACFGLLLLLAIALPTFAVLRIDPTIFLRSKLKAGQIGLIDYAHRSTEFSAERSNLIATSKNEVFYVGTVFYRTPKENDKAILEQIKNGVHFKFLVADPRGIHFAANASFFGDTSEGLAEESEDTFEGYLKIKKQADQAQYKSGSIELRLVDRVFPSALYFYDPRDPHGQLELVARDFDVNAPEMPSFRFAATAGGVVERYFQSAQELWNLATPYESWIAGPNNGEQDGGGQPATRPVSK